MLFYRAALPLSQATLTFVSGLIRTHRSEIDSRWRALNPGQQALLVLVYLRKGEPFAEVGAGFGVSTTTCWRYVEETVELLARRAPTLRATLRTAKRAGVAYVVVDGTLIPIDRVAADRRAMLGICGSAGEERTFPVISSGSQARPTLARRWRQRSRSSGSALGSGRRLL